MHVIIFELVTKIAIFPSKYLKFGDLLCSEENGNSAYSDLTEYLYQIVTFIHWLIFRYFVNFILR